MIANLRKRLGFDGAVAYTFLARATNILGSTGTVLLIVRFLSPVEQGYYYTLLSLVTLQLVFELGFSFVIQQLAAHECVHLELHPDGTANGDPVAHARLASALQLSVRWYSVAAGAMVLILAPLGAFFFERHTAAGGAHVAWQGPWFSAVVASAVSLWFMPFYAFLEGCGHVRAVAAMRFRQGVAAALCAWTFLLLHRGLYAPAAVIVGQIAMGALFLTSHHRLLIRLLRHQTRKAAICWSSEVWPFQWRIAVSSMCTYLMAQVFIPILFALRGPVEAGQMGMSLSITGYMTTLALSWTSTKATPFGNLIARNRYEELYRLFRKTLRHSLAVFAMGALAACAGAAVLPLIAPRLAARMVSPQLFAVLVAAAGANFVVQSLAIVLRAFKREPFLVQSLVVAAVTLGLVAATARSWGNAGAAMSYLAASVALALPWALMLFIRKRRTLLLAPPVAFHERQAV